MSNHPAEAMQILCRVFSDQYFVKEDDIIPRPKEEIRSGSVQSPHDTECHYRNKGGNHIKGYSINVTETCDGDSSLNLVTSVQVDVAGAADNDFLQSAIESSQEIVQENIQIVNADGAYHSIANQDYCREKDIDFVVGAIQGKPSRYDLSYDENAELVVTDLQTNTIVPSRRIESRKNEQQPKWAIKDEKGRNRYFSQKEIDTCLLRKQTGNRSQTELNVRNNVEATIFQLGYHYSNDKSRYRGLVKHRIWANVRCLWINFVRILNFIVKSVSNNTRNSITRINLYLFLTIFIETILVQCSVKKNCQSTQKIKLRRE
jgi:hypothetical protein